MTRADSRPRIHVWPAGEAAAWSIGPSGRRSPAPSAGAAVDAALSHLQTRSGAVVILEASA